jgi:ABC-2 type transport system ATP-binding protein
VSSVIQVAGLVKRFGDLAAVDGIDFTVETGEIFGFLGPNGAGKSTTIKILATLMRPTDGQARLAGFDVVAQPDQVRRSIGVVFQDPSLDDRLTAVENLQFHAMLYDVPKGELRQRMDQVLEMVGLAERRDSLVRTYSGGMRRRLEIARGLLHTPKVLFLDEPTTGLDPQTRTAIWEYVRQLRREVGVTVFMTTHYMDEAENCDRMAIIDHGRLQAVDSPEALKRRVGGDQILVRGDPGLKEDLAATYSVAVLEVDGAYQFQVDAGAEFVPRVVADFNGRIRSIQVKQPSLDDVFLQLTGRAIREEEASEKYLMRQGVRMWRGRR